MFIIAIDPDVNESGICMANGRQLLYISTLPIWEIFAFLSANPVDVVIIEAGWLNKSRSYHGGGKGSAYKVGRNSEIGRQIERFCIAQKIPYILEKPRGYSDKNRYTPDVFFQITGWSLPKANKEKTQDMIVAGLFAYNYFNLHKLA